MASTESSSISVAEIILKYVCPGVGAIICQLMWTAPLKSIRNARRKGTLGDLNPMPWAVMTGNCIGWVAYSFLIKNLFVFFGNATGFIISLWLNMNASKLLYHEYYNYNHQKAIAKHDSIVNSDYGNNSTENGNTKKVEIIVLTEEEQRISTVATSSQDISYSDESGNNMDTEILAVNKIIQKDRQNECKHEMLFLSMVTFWITLFVLIIFIPTTMKQKQLVVGVAVNINLCFFYGAPLSTILHVLKNKHSNSIHRQTMIMNTLNGLFWCAYGIYRMDLFIVVPNGLGALLGFIQGFLCLIFPRNHNHNTTGELCES